MRHSNRPDSCGRSRNGRPRQLLGAAIFATAGTVSASMVAMNPMLGGRRKLAAVAARAARSGMPQVVGLAVDAGGVDVYPLTWSGQVVGDAIARWERVLSPPKRSDGRWSCSWRSPGRMVAR